MQICQSLIGGKPVKSNLPIIEKRYPATGEVIAHIEPASDAMLDEAVAIASQAQISWAKTDAFDRAKILHKAANLMREANDELAHLEVRDVGKVLAKLSAAMCHQEPMRLTILPPVSPRKMVISTNGTRPLAIACGCRLGFALALAHGIIQCRLPAGNQHQH